MPEPLRPLPARDASTPAEPEQGAPGLQAALSMALCLLVLLASVALVETDRRISETLRRLPIEREADGARADASLPRGAPPSLVLLVLLDGLRSDRLEAAPHLRAFAGEGLAFQRVGAQASHALVSVKSLLTGKYPASLLLEETGADLLALASLEDPERFLAQAFDAVPAALALRFGRAGYRTAGFTTGDWLRADNGFGTSFQSFSERGDGLAANAADAAGWVSASSRDALAFVHSAELAGASDAADYDVRLARADDALGALFAQLRADERWDDALVLVAGDHGQSLGERGLVGAGDLYLEQLLVPLVLKLPADWGVTPAEVEEAVELVDVFPSLLAACGLRAPDDLDGTSFLPVVLRGVRGKQYLVAQTSWTSGAANAARRCVLQPGGWQVIHDARDDLVEFFALGEDPGGLVPAEPSLDAVPPFLHTLMREASVRPGE